MTAKNDITGDSIRTKSSSQKYIDNYDSIFRKDIQNEKQLELDFSDCSDPDHICKCGED
jgi:hypothetical protein